MTDTHVDNVPDGDSETIRPLPPLPDTSHLPVLRVHRNDDDVLAYKLPGKGARWRGGFASFGELMHAVDADMPGHCLIDFVTARD